MTMLDLELVPAAGSGPTEAGTPAPSGPHQPAAPPDPQAAAGEPAPQRPVGAASVGELAFDVLRVQFQQVLAHEAGTRLGQDPEALHDMRVAMRRMRAALKTFRDFLPARVVRLARELAWLSAALGKVRDVDVQLARLHAWQQSLEPAERPTLDALSARLERRRETARRRMLVALDSRRHGRLVQRVQRELGRGPGRLPEAGRRAAAIEAPEIVTRRYKSLIKHGRRIEPTSPPEQYHRLRIRCKSLRYAVEFHAELWGQPARKLVRSTVALQDLLGEHQDAVVAERDLRQIVVRGGLPRQSVFAIGRIAERYAAGAAGLRAELDEALAKLRGTRWRRLRRAMEQRALDAARDLPRGRRGTR